MERGRGWPVVVAVVMVLVTVTEVSAGGAHWGSWPTWQAVLGALLPTTEGRVYPLRSNRPSLLLDLKKFKRWLASTKRRSGPIRPRTSDTVTVWTHPRGGELIMLDGRRESMGGEVFWLKGDVLQRVQLLKQGPKLFMTQVGVIRWERRYRQGRLRLLITHRGNVGQKTAPYGVRRFDYRKGAQIPYRSVSFADLAALRAHRWRSCSEFSTLGRILRTHHRRGLSDRCPFYKAP